MELKITRCRSHEGLRCPKCAAAINPADIIALSMDGGSMSINCVACHAPVLEVEFENNRANVDFCPYCEG